MQYSIMGFNQEKLVSVQTDELKLDVSDILLMNYIQKALSQPSMKKISDEEGQPYVWLNHTKILEDLPILNIKEIMLRKRLAKLVELNLIKTKTVANEKNRGSRTYYTITEIFESLQYDSDSTTHKKLSMVEQPRIKNYTCSDEPHIKNYMSDSKLLSDKELVFLSKDKNTDSKPEKIESNSSVNITEKIKDIYNTKCTNLPKVSKMTDKRVRCVRSILKKYSISEVEQVFEIANKSDFLTGKNNRGWKADFDFLLREDKFVSVLEGKYNNKKSYCSVSSDKPSRVTQAEYDANKKAFWEAVKNGTAEKF